MNLQRALSICILIVALAFSASAQYYNGKSKVLKRAGITIDSMALVTWPTHIPTQALCSFHVSDIIAYKSKAGQSFIIPIGTTMNPSNRSHVAVYYSASLDLSKATLHRQGLGITQLTVPLGATGYYYVIVIGPLGDFVQLYHYDGNRIGRGRREMRQMGIRSLDLNETYRVEPN